MTPPRVIAAKIVNAVLHGQSLTSALPIFLTQANPRDKPLIQSLSYGVFRFYHQLILVIQYRLTKPLKPKDQDLLALLLVGVYELLYQKTADHVVINETVNAAKVLKKAWACALINAILRYIQRQPNLIDSVFEKTQQQALKTSHPDWLMDLFYAQWGEKTTQIIEANNTQAPMVLRTNSLQIDCETYLKKLKEAKINAVLQAVTANGIVLEKPQTVADLPGFFDGLISVQDGAAQLAVEFLKLSSNDRVLDVCCAPGGKLTHLLETKPKLAQVVAWDKSADRMKLVEENIKRLKLNTLNQLELQVGDAADLARQWQGDLFDKILLDAPCSGSGVIRRHPDSKYLRRKSDIVETLPAEQSRLLQAIWPLLKPGGLLIYATCSILSPENEAVIQAFLAMCSDAQHHPITKEGMLPQTYGAYILPGDANRDGFYYCVIEKTR